MIGLTGTILFAQTALGHAATRQAEDGTIAPHVVGPDDPRGTLLVAGTLPDGVPATAAGTLAEARATATAKVNYVAMALIIAFTAIAVVNTLAMGRPPGRGRRGPGRIGRPSGGGGDCVVILIT